MPKAQKVSLIETLKTLVVNPYFDMLTMIYVLGYMSVSLSFGVAVYYFMYIMGDANLYGKFMTMYSIPSVIGLIIVPFLVKKFNSIRNVNLGSFIAQVLFRIAFVAAAIAKNMTAMLVLYGICSLTNCSMMGTFNALVAEASEYTARKTGKKLDGSMYSCTSFGMKVGSGIGSGLSGWLLAASGFDAAAIIYYFLKVEKVNRELRNNA